MKKTILVVDDSCAVRQHVSMILVRAGFTMAEAADGQQGLAMVDSKKIDLVICDINMPVMDGLEMVEKVKAKPEHKSLPILMLTTEGQVAMVARAKKAGAVGWMVKPFDPAQLEQTVSRLVNLSMQA